jgi:hypothetical protein
MRGGGHFFWTKGYSRRHTDFGEGSGLSFSQEGLNHDTKALDHLMRALWLETLYLKQLTPSASTFQCSGSG